MAPVAGKYQLVENKNFKEHLMGHGIEEAKAQMVDDFKPIMEIVINGDEVSLLSNAPVDNANSTFTLNKEVEETLPSGIPLKSIVTLEGDTLTICSKSASGKGGKRVYKFSADGVVVTLTSENPDIPTATRTYKRI